MLELIFTDGNEEINLLAITRPHRNTHAQEGERELVVSLLSLGFQKYSTGIRILKVGLDSSESNIDEFYDRAALGFSRHYGSVIIELLFLRIQLG
jgi:hypothetical protein